jgi:outer membrane protein assembly factor BamB
MTNSTIRQIPRSKTSLAPADSIEGQDDQGSFYMGPSAITYAPRSTITVGGSGATILDPSQPLYLITTNGSGGQQTVDLPLFSTDSNGLNAPYTGMSVVIVLQVQTNAADSIVITSNGQPPYLKGSSQVPGPGVLLSRAGAVAFFAWASDRWVYDPTMVDFTDSAPEVGGGGTTWYIGSGAPSTSLGNLGDLYLDGVSGGVYQKSDHGLVMSTLWDWNTPGGEPNYSTAVMVPKKGGGGQWVVFQTWDWYLYVLDYANGAVRWRYPFAGPNYDRSEAGDINGDGEPEFIGASHDGTARCIDSTGALIWLWNNVYTREGTGTVTSATASSITDSTKNWVPNTFNYRGTPGQGAQLQITSGTGSGQSSEIIATTATTLTIAGTFSPIPNATSHYTIVPKYDSDPYYQHTGTLVGTRLYLTGFDGQIVCLNATTGAMIWRYQTGESIEPFPLVMDVDSDGQLECCSGSIDGYFYCLNATTGALKWRTNCSGGNTGAAGGLDAFPVAADIDSDGTIEVLVSARCGNVFILNGRTGVIKHTTQYLGGEVNTRPAIFADGRFVVGNLTGNVWCFNTDGTLHWKYQLVASTNGIRSSPAVTNFGSLGGEVVVSCTMNGTIGAFNEAGTLIGLYQVPDSIEGTPLVGDLDGDGNVEMLISTLGGHETLLRLTGTGGLIWAIQGSLMGPEGLTGPPGPIGSTGPQGPAVPNVSGTFASLATSFPSPVAGNRAFVTDCTTATFLAVAAGGGTNRVPVVYTGTQWVVG